jgi:hypothetical protein
MVSFGFKHWALRKDKPKSKKAAVKLGGRLLLHPQTEEPWLLIFNPDYDDKSQLVKGEAPDGRDVEDGEVTPGAGEAGTEPGT